MKIFTFVRATLRLFQDSLFCNVFEYDTIIYNIKMVINGNEGAYARL